MSWFNRKRSGILDRSQFYVCFLGAKEAKGLKGREVVIPAMKQMLRENLERAATKVTLQINEKGMKIIQNIPVVTKSGKIKLELVKFLVPHYSISYSMIGPYPYDDLVLSIMLIFNPETRCPVHVHGYRCDSPQTATLLHTGLQTLICRPENVRRFAELEFRLIARGLLNPPKRSRPQQEDYLNILPPVNINSQPELFPESIQLQSSHAEAEGNSDDMYFDLDGPPSDPDEMDQRRVARLHQEMFVELKQKLRNKEKCPILIPPKDYSTATWCRRESSGPMRSEFRNQPQRIRHPVPAEMMARRISPRFDTNWTSSTSGIGSDGSSSEERGDSSKAAKLSRLGKSMENLVGPMRHYDTPPMENHQILHQNHHQNHHQNPKPQPRLRRFGDTTRIHPLKEAMHRPQSQLILDESENWLARKRLENSRFFSVEDLHEAVNMLPNPRSRASVAVTGHSPSLWHLPTVIDPFGKRYERQPQMWRSSHNLHQMMNSSSQHWGQ